MWPFSKKKSDPIFEEYSVDEMENALIRIKGKGAGFATYYAIMSGYIHLNSRDNSVELLQYACAEPAFTDIGVDRAVSKLKKEMDDLCKGDANNTRADILGRFKRLVAKEGFENLCNRIGFDIPRFIIDQTKSRREADISAIKSVIDEKRDYLKPILMRHRSKKDKYGDADFSDYIAEISEFLDKYFPQNSLPFFWHLRPLIVAVDHVAPWFLPTIEREVMPLNGIDFEYWCARQIEQQGWSTRVSKASGDQGVDIEALKGGKVVTIQCKRYDKPIGNSSVQEVYTGMVHYRADAACVIGTGGFTKSAFELSQNTGVILLDAESIEEFSSIMLAKLGV